MDIQVTIYEKTAELEKHINAQWSSAFTKKSTDPIEALFSTEAEHFNMNHNDYSTYCRRILKNKIEKKQQALETAYKVSWASMVAGLCLMGLSKIKTACQQDVYHFCYRDRNFQRSFRGDEFCKSLEYIQCGSMPSFIQSVIEGSGALTIFGSLVYQKITLDSWWNLTINIQKILDDDKKNV